MNLSGLHPRFANCELKEITILAGSPVVKLIDPSGVEMFLTLDAALVGSALVEVKRLFTKPIAKTHGGLRLVK